VANSHNVEADQAMEGVPEECHYFAVPATILILGNTVGKGSLPTKGFQDTPNLHKLKTAIKAKYQQRYPGDKIEVALEPQRTLNFTKETYETKFGKTEWYFDAGLYFP
jgi:hypothetical protein